MTASYGKALFVPTPTFQPSRRDLMLDIETLGIRPGCAILSIGAVVFDIAGTGPLDISPFYHTIDLRTCERAGLAIEADTVLWWLRRNVALPTTQATPITEALKLLEEYILVNDCLWIWAHGADFDIPILNEAYQRTQQRQGPWGKYVQDTRTLYRLAEYEPQRNSNAHNALADAQHQVLQVQTAYQQLRKSVILQMPLGKIEIAGTLTTPTAEIPQVEKPARIEYCAVPGCVTAKATSLFCAAHATPPLLKPCTVSNGQHTWNDGSQYHWKKGTCDSCGFVKPA